MKPQLLTLFLILALPFTGHTASEWTITKKHRVIQEASVQPSKRGVPIGTKISRLRRAFATLRGDTQNGYAERLIRTLKEEEVNINNLDTLTAHTGTGRLRVPRNRMPRRTTLHDASETVARRIRRPNTQFRHYLRRSLRQRKRFRRRGEKLCRQGRPSVLCREGYNRQTRTCSRRDHDSTSRPY